MKHQTRNLAILSNENIHTVRLVFEDTPHKSYCYLAKKEWELKEGDSVLTPSLNHNGFGIAEVVSVDDEADIDVSMDIFYKFCNGKVDFLAAEEEGKLSSKESEINKQRNKQARRQLRQQLMDGLLEAPDDLD